MMLWRYPNPDWFHRDHELGVDPFKICNGGHDPRSVAVDVATLNIIQGLEHVEVPLTELVDPRRNEVEAFRVLDDPIETVLIKSRDLC